MQKAFAWRMNKQAIQCMHFAQAIASRPDFGSKNCTKLGSLRVLKRGSILSAFEKYNHPEVIGKFLNILYVSPLDTVRFLFFLEIKKRVGNFCSLIEIHAIWLHIHILPYTYTLPTKDLYLCEERISSDYTTLRAT